MRFNYDVFIKRTYVAMACNLNVVVKNERVLKVTGSHVHFRSGSVLKTVLDKDVKQQSTNRK